MPGATRKLLGSGALYTLATVAPILTVVAVTPFVTNALGAEEYGEVAVAVSVYQVFSVLLGYGLPSIITRDALLAKAGYRGAAGYVVVGTALALMGFVVVAGVGPWWIPLVFTGVSPFVVVLAIAAGAGLAMVTLSQALMRAAERVVSFVAMAALAALLPPALGLLIISVWQPDAQGYAIGLASGYLLSGTLALLAAIRFAPPVFNGRDVRKALRVGLPTVPHGLAVPALLTVVMALVVRADGLAVAGALQISVMLGTAVITVLNAVNNAWSPLIFRASESDRPRVLTETTQIVAALTVVMICGFITVAPFFVPLIGGRAVLGLPATQAAAAVATSGAFAVLYLANIHLTFLSQRTLPLAYLTPASAIIAVLSAYALSTVSEVPLIAWASAWPIFYLFQSLNSYVLARRSGHEPTRVGRSVPLLVLALAAATTATLVPDWIFVSLTALTTFALSAAFLWWYRKKGPSRKKPSDSRAMEPRSKRRTGYPNGVRTRVQYGLLLIAIAAASGVGAGFLSFSGAGSGYPILRVVGALAALLLFVLKWREITSLLVRNVLVALFCVWSLLTLAWTADPTATLTSLVGLASVTLLGAALVVAGRVSQIVTTLLCLFTTTSAISILLAWLVPSIGAVDVVHPTEGPISQPIGVFAWNSDMGFTAGIGGILAVALMLRNRNWWLVAPVAVNLFAVYYSNAASSILTTALGLCVVLLMSGRWVAWGTIVVGIAIAGGTIIAVGPARAIDILFGALGRSSSLTGRTALWQATWEQSLERPFGWGFGVAPDLKILSTAQHSHNGFLQVLFDRGWVGAFLLLALAALALIRAIRHHDAVGVPLLTVTLASNLANDYLSFASLGLALLLWQSFLHLPGVLSVPRRGPSEQRILISADSPRELDEALTTAMSLWPDAGRFRAECPRSILTASERAKRLGRNLRPTPRLLSRRVSLVVDILSRRPTALIAAPLTRPRRTIAEWLGLRYVQAAGSEATPTSAKEVVTTERFVTSL